MLRHSLRYFLLFFLLLIGLGVYFLPSLYFKTSSVSQADDLNHDELDLYSKILATEMEDADIFLKALKKRDSVVYRTLSGYDSTSNSALNSKLKLLLSSQINQENEELRFYHEILETEMEEANTMLMALQERDHNVYQTIFEAEPIPGSIRQTGIGGANRYKDLMEKGLQREQMILSSFQKIDKLKKQMYIQATSYDEIMEMAEKKSEMWAYIPAIQPMKNNDLKRIASGYGMRIHPILKVKKMHPGMDFKAPAGTSVFTTADGIVEKVSHSTKNYGRTVLIDHGYGYKTFYGHLDAYTVKKGQKIKRGEQIGTVGNTGYSTSPHLHYEVLKNDQPVNPVHYFFKELDEEVYQKILELSSIENQSLS